MNLDVYNTHMELYPYSKDDYPVIEDMYMATDKFTDTKYPCGYMIEDGKLYLPRGTQVSKIENICGVVATYKNECDEYDKMNKNHYGLYDPRDKLQENSIKFLTEETNSQLGLNLGTGRGKSYCVAYSINELKMKAIIITPNESLKQQWMVNTFYKMLDYRKKDLMNIAGSNIIEGIMDDSIDTDDTEVFFVNHQTLRSYMTSTNGYMLHQFFKKLKVGIKVYDESHLEFGNILLIDFFSNTYKTWYLTATFDRTDKSQSRCFKRAFNSVITYGEMESYKVTKKHTIYHVVNINSRISVQNRKKVVPYRGMSVASYDRYAFLDDPTDTAYQTILKILNILKDVDGKILVFVGLIDAADTVANKIKRDYPDKSVSAYHSRMSKEEKESAEKKDIIVSTIKSCGTGRDIPGLRAVICAEPIASKVTAQQMFGRLRPYAPDKDTFFFDIIDTCIPTINYWWRARFRKIESLAKDVIYLNMDK